MEHGARRFVVRGLVQGVGFRWWARSLARQLELHGSVRNLDDGSVELIAFGPHAVLGQLHEQLRIGPAGARVDDIEEQDWVGSSPGEFRIDH